MSHTEQDRRGEEAGEELGEEPAEWDQGSSQAAALCPPRPCMEFEDCWEILEIKTSLQGREFVSRVAITNYHKLGSLKQKYIVSILETRGQKSRHHGVGSPEALGENPLHANSWLWWLPAPSTFLGLWIHHSCLFLRFTWPSPCVSEFQ